jgi:hypothetical protein
VRPVGEVKSELYPEPECFQMSFMGLLLMYPEVLDSVLSRRPSSELGHAQRRVLSRCNALDLSGLAFQVTWGREMWLLAGAASGAGPGAVAAAAGYAVDDAAVARLLAFNHDTTVAYRQDGRPYPSATSGFGSDYRILDPGDATALADATVAVDRDAAQGALRMWGAIRALSFLMEAETREGLMQHGPYPLDADGRRQLIVCECKDLRWSHFPEFPIPGARWELSSNPFPYGDIALALVLEDVSMTGDRFGTLYVEPWSEDNVVAASLMTRGEDEWAPGDLRPLDVADARELGEHCDDIQAEMFLQLAGWSLEQRTVAGYCQKMRFPGRFLTAAGADRAEVDAFVDSTWAMSAAVWGERFENIPTADSMPFYGKLGEFIAGDREHLFTPFADG